MNSTTTNNEIKYMNFIDFMDTYQDIINFILQHKHKDGICYISKKEIAEHINLSVSSVNKKLKKFLEFDNAVQLVGANKFIVNLEDISQSSLYNKIIFMHTKLLENPNLALLPYEKQGEVFDMTVKQIQMAYGYIYVQMTK